MGGSRHPSPAPSPQHRWFLASESLVSVPSSRNSDSRIPHLSVAGGIIRIRPKIPNVTEVTAAMLYTAAHSHNLLA